MCMSEGRIPVSQNEQSPSNGEGCYGCGDAGGDAMPQNAAGRGNGGLGWEIGVEVTAHAWRTLNIRGELQGAGGRSFSRLWLGNWLEDEALVKCPSCALCSAASTAHCLLREMRAGDILCRLWRQHGR